MTLFLIVWIVVHAPSLTFDQSQPGPAEAPLVGDWRLNLQRTHYGTGVELRRDERFSCTVDHGKLHCIIQTTRADGHQLTGEFSAGLDGTKAKVTGIPDIDEVSLSLTRDSLMDATFLLRGTPVFGYRAMRSSDRQSLMIISVDPVTRRVLTTVVVYDLQRQHR